VKIIILYFIYIYIYVFFNLIVTMERENLNPKFLTVLVRNTKMYQLSYKDFNELIMLS